MASVALCCVAGGRTYLDYADRLMESALKHFKPTDDVILRVIVGDEGWPDGTMRRYHHLLDHMPFVDYVYLCDADMLFVADVGREVLGKLVATQHPGYVGVNPSELPYERRSESACSCEGYLYFCGGFVGGRWVSMFTLARMIATLIDVDAANGIVPVWHDESALNKVLSGIPPTKVLSPSFCYPDNDSWYQTIWPKQYERKLVALDKTVAERGER